MRRRILASAVLASMLCWSMASLVASPLAMRSWLARAATAISEAHQHSCCPRSHSRWAQFVLAALPPMTMPCGNQHPCCVQQGPENSPALPALRNDSRPDSRFLAVGIDSPGLSVSRPAPVEVSERNYSELSLLRSTVLRI